MVLQFQMVIHISSYNWTLHNLIFFFFFYKKGTSNENSILIIHDKMRMRSLSIEMYVPGSEYVGRYPQVCIVRDVLVYSIIVFIYKLFCSACQMDWDSFKLYLLTDSSF
jgi:hypothetical protein